MSPAGLTLVRDAILKLSRPEEARRRRTWEKQLVLNSIAELAPRINGSFRGYCYHMIVFPLVRPSRVDGGRLFGTLRTGLTQRREPRKRLFPCWSGRSSGCGRAAPPDCRPKLTLPHGV